MQVHIHLPARHKYELAKAQENLTELQAQCDHKMPDGSTALEGGFMMTVCKICGVSDL